MQDASEGNAPPWNADAIFPGGPTSHRVLITWLALPDNYARWHACRGSTRSTYLTCVLTGFRQRGLPLRSLHDIRAKIEEIEWQMREAIAWRDTRAFQVAKRRGTAREELLRVCRDYDALAPVMVPLLRQGGKSTATGTTTQSAPVPPAVTTIASSRRSDPRTDSAITRTPTTARSQIPPSPTFQPDPKEASNSYPSITAHAVSIVSRDSPSVRNQDGHVGPPARPVPHQLRSTGGSNWTRAGDNNRREQYNHSSPHKQPTPVVQVDDDTSTPNQPVNANTALDALLRQVEIDRIQHERRSHALQEERLTLDVARQRIQVTKERALARHELRCAGVPEHEIDLAFPLSS